MSYIQIDLPDALADEARRAGLLASEKIAAMLRAQLRQQRVGTLFDAMDRMAAADEPAKMSPEEVAREIAAMRAERRKPANR